MTTTFVLSLPGEGEVALRTPVYIQPDNMKLLRQWMDRCLEELEKEPENDPAP